MAFRMGSYIGFSGTMVCAVLANVYSIFINNNCALFHLWCKENFTNIKKSLNMIGARGNTVYKNNHDVMGKLIEICKISYDVRS